MPYSINPLLENSTVILSLKGVWTLDDMTNGINCVREILMTNTDMNFCIIVDFTGASIMTPVNYIQLIRKQSSLPTPTNVNKTIVVNANSYIAYITKHFMKLLTGWHIQFIDSIEESQLTST